MSTLRPGKVDKGKKRTHTSLFEVADDAEVLVFDQDRYGRRATESKAKGSSTSDRSAAATNPTDADDIADMEVSQIWESLKDSVEDIHASNLKGKERKKYAMEKVVRLGGNPPKKQKVPTYMRVGMRLKAKERANKEKAMARENDIILAKKTLQDRTSKSRSRK